MRISIKSSYATPIFTLKLLTHPWIIQQELARFRKMAAKLSTAFVLIAVAAFLASLGYVKCVPAIAANYDAMEVCIENCAQCKKMLGAWFDGPLCAESCIKFRGKIIPECEDFASIAPFLNKL